MISSEIKLPRKPYDEVSSEFIREQIRQGSFEDTAYRQYINELVWLEWYTTDGPDPNTGGISRYGLSVHRWKLAAAYPEAYDAVQQDFGNPTRDGYSWTWCGEDDPEERRRLAVRHRKEWRAVTHGNQRPPEDRTELNTRGHRSFAPFRFPVLPYDSIQSPFIREEIQQGSFDDSEYRRQVNQFAWIEWYTTEWEAGGLFGQIVTNWKLTAKHPRVFDIVRRELDEPTRDAIELRGGIGYRGDDPNAAVREHKRAWQAVQERRR